MAGLQTSSGLPLEGQRVTITEARFAYHTDIGRDTLIIDFETEEGLTQEQGYTYGTRGTPSKDGGVLLEAPDKFPSMSSYGRLINSAVAAVAEAGLKPEDELGGGDTGNASIWVGTQWVMRGDERDTQNPETGEAKKGTLMVFDEYLGRGEAPARASKSQGPDDAKGAAGDASNELWDELVALAEQHDSHDDFVEAAFEQHPDAAKDPALRKAVYTTGKGSMWATKT